MALQRFHEGKCRRFVTGFDEALKHFTLMIDGAPEAVHLAVDLHADLIKVPAPMSNASHAADPLPTDVTCEHRAEHVPPEAHYLREKVDTA